MEGPNPFYAVRVDGRFASLMARNVPRQDRPYRPLVEVVKTQPVFDLEEVSGTLAGYRFPDFTGGLNLPGFHVPSPAVRQCRSAHGGPPYRATTS